MSFVEVAKVSDVKPGNSKVVNAGGKELALFNVDGKFFVTDNACVHKGGPLGEGTLDGDVVSCPWHAWKYNVKTGVSPVNAAAKVQPYKVKVDGDNVMVEV